MMVGTEVRLEKIRAAQPRVDHTTRGRVLTNEFVPTELCRPSRPVEETGATDQDLIVLDSGNDPFLADSVGLRGGPGRRARAEWFADLWTRLKISPGVHQRRIHYIFVSQPIPITMDNGEEYTNTNECLKFLNKAARDARTLGLVPADAIVDRRRSGFAAHLAAAAPAALVWEHERIEGIELPPTMKRPRLGLRRPQIPQGYHLELWAEKSTVDDVLIPLAESYGLNVVSGAGEQTSFACRDLVDRAEASERPVRILYLSDFDPGGMSMPVAAARKIEHEIRRRRLDDLDVQVRPVVLTHEQCVEYALPRTPLKEGEVRKAQFEKRYGEGATELDALEALHRDCCARSSKLKSSATTIQPYPRPRQNGGRRDRGSDRQD
jgi:hypothetical protein